MVDFRLRSGLLPFIWRKQVFHVLNSFSETLEKISLAASRKVVLNLVHILFRGTRECVQSGEDIACNLGKFLKEIVIA